MESHGMWVGIAVFILLMLAVLIQVAYQWPTQENSSNVKTFGAARLNTKSKVFSIVNSDGMSLLEGSMDGDDRAGKTDFDSCTNNNFDSCLLVKSSEQTNVQCYQVVWKSLKCGSHVFKDCFDLGDSHWYGGYEDHNQSWPLEKSIRNEAAYVSGDSYQSEVGGVQERYFINSNGIGIIIDDDVPLHISLNQSGDNRLCLISKFEKTPYLNHQSRLPWLKYVICNASNVRTVHDYMYNKFLTKPPTIPDERMFRSPVWSTWAQYHKDINQSIVVQFAKDILKYNYTHSQVEIDDEWTPSYGEMEFDKNKFPDPRGMVFQLQQLGFRVTLWIHPFFNTESPAFDEADDRGYLIKQYGNDKPALVRWWDGKAAGVLDVTNQDAFQWFINKTEYLKSRYNINSFKFDAGEVAYLPELYRLSKPEDNPNIYSKKWAQLALKIDPDVRHQEVRVGTRTQHLPLFVRMLDKDSVWSFNNGLKTLIPSALQFGLIGYPFILPDMIGGNAYDENQFSLEETTDPSVTDPSVKSNKDVKPDSELFIRWLQASVFLPSLQFSIVPWQYDQFTIDVSKAMVDLHEEFAPRMIELAHEFTRTGAPIVRPLWWIAPEDPIAQIIDDEFLVGDDLLVAPVLVRGARSRDIYLPPGVWKDKLRNGQIRGGKWMRDYRANLHELPYFTLMVAG